MPLATMETMSQAVIGCIQRINIIPTISSIPCGPLRRNKSNPATLSETSPPPPMPDPDELNKQFAKFAADLDLNNDHEESLNGMPADKKWAILCEHQMKRDRSDAANANPEYYAEQLDSFLNELSSEIQLSDRKVLIGHLEALKILLNSQSHSYVQKFLDCKGLELMTETLETICKDYTGEDDLQEICFQLLLCFKSLLNSTAGRESVLKSEATLLAISIATGLEHTKAKISALDILSGLCFVSHCSVLQAFTEASQFLGQRVRFQRLLFDLWRPFPDPKEDIRLKTTIVSFINALLKNGAAENSLEYRLSIRWELLSLGMQEIVDHLRNNLPDAAVLQDHIDLFEMMRQEDEEEYSSSVDLDSSSCSTTTESELSSRHDSDQDSSSFHHHQHHEDPHRILNNIQQRLQQSPAYPHLIALFRHLSLMPAEQKHVELWRFFDTIVQSLMMQCNLVEADGLLPKPIDMDYLISRLHQDSDYEKLKKIHEDTETELKRTKEDLDTAKRQLEQLTASLDNLKKSAGRPVSIDTSSSSSGVLADDHHGTTSSSSSSSSSSSTSSDSGVNVPSSSPLTPPDSPPTVSPSSSSPSSSSSKIPPPPPPPPPPSSNIPPPPPLPVGGLHSLSRLTQQQQQPKKKVPKPKVELKTVNWNKLAPTQIEGTIWTEMKDEEMYPIIDLQQIELKFASTSQHRNGPEGEGGDERDSNCSHDINATWRRMSRDSVISIMEPRRAQNCTIILSKLKLNPSEIRQCLLNMDKHGRIPKDLAEQLIKFVPTKEEVELLEKTVLTASPSFLATADRFLWEITQVPRYEERLKCLHYRKVFKDRMEDLTPQIMAVSGAAKSTKESDKLKEILAVVLAVGNYLNHGKRNADAQGFPLSALNNLMDVKSGATPVSNGGFLVGDYTLLHFVVEVVERNFPHLLRIKRDLGQVFDAARISGQELESELNRLNKGLEMIREEIELQKALTQPSYSSVNEEASLQNENAKDNIDGSKPESSPRRTTSNQTIEGDEFVHVMSAFLEFASTSSAEINKAAEQMKTEFASCLIRFGSDPKKSSPDEFFGVLGKFLSSFTDVHRQLYKQREEEERKKRTLNWSIFGTVHRRTPLHGSALAIQTSGKNVRTLPATPSTNNNNNSNKNNHKKGDFDQLIHALQSGELYSADLDRLRSSFKVPKRQKDNNKKDNKKSNKPSRPTTAANSKSLIQQQQQNGVVGKNSSSIVIVNQPMSRDR